MNTPCTIISAKIIVRRTVVKLFMTVIASAVVTVFVQPYLLAADAPALIPQPQRIEMHDGVFRIQKSTRIIIDKTTHDSGNYLAEHLRLPTGFKLKVQKDPTSDPMKGAILLKISAEANDIGAEGYQLSVTPESVVIRGSDSAGVFYGVQTLMQLLPPEAFSSNKVPHIDWTIPCVQISDQPRFHWRGLMLDVSRHFFNKQEVENLLDVMAQQKLNTFHWHLVDDQGWRIQLKKYPKLTDVGAWRNGVGFGLDPKSTTAYGEDGRYGGFYTKADIKEVIAHAKALHITIVPEIEMPGHSTAALAAYPQFSCTGGPFSIDPKGGIFKGVYCAGNDDTFKFLDNVLTEVMAMFPGKYIHIGGDEVPKDNWKQCDKCQARIKAEGLKDEHELQSYFIRRVEKIVAAHGHELIGWSEIREGGLASSAAVMDWIGGAVEAASDGHDVVMSPTAFCYFDYYQSRNHASEPKAIGGFLPLNKAYEFDPIPTNLPPQFASHIVGGQANLWTEYVASFGHVQYMIFPRICALSEAVWSPKESRDWGSFTNRLQAEFQRLDAEGVNYRKGIPDTMALKQ